MPEGEKLVFMVEWVFLPLLGGGSLLKYNTDTWHIPEGREEAQVGRENFSV